MSKYSEESLVQKLGRLVDTQDSISLSTQWLMYHRKHAKTSVQVWSREVTKASAARKLTLLHLCNDVVQMSRKKGEEFIKEFAKVLPESLSHIYRHATADVQNKVMRILTIWEERHVYPTAFVDKLKETLTKKGGDHASAGQPLALKTGSGSGSSHSHSHSHVPPSPKRESELKPLITKYDAVRRASGIRIASERAAGNAPPVFGQLDNFPNKANPNPTTDDIEKAVSALTAHKNAIEADIADREALVTEIKTFLALQEAELLKVREEEQANAAKMDALSNGLAAITVLASGSFDDTLGGSSTDFQGMGQDGVGAAVAAAGFEEPRTETSSGDGDNMSMGDVTMDGSSSFAATWLQNENYPWNAPSALT
ncbi:Regulation of nuclear pre-mRNA domain-containing protein 1A [Irineochytrium annulatum]|nr:Regulation of nuclear pre-mRNA domain-containing protein 1A [Irineochytrium annulatum]